MADKLKLLTTSSIASGLMAAALISAASAQDDGARAESGGAADTIVVTAARRGEQDLQDIPFAVSVIGGDELDESNFEGANDAITEVAGVAIYDTQQGGGSKISIRGVTSNASIFSGSGTIAYYLDSVPFSFVKTPLTPDANAYDLDRVEVVSGPQGTLYGATALGGVVLINTKDANVDEFEAKARATVSTTHDGGENYGGDLAVNFPLIPGKLAIRGVVGYQDNSGWIDSVLTDDNNTSEIQTYRIKVAAQPTDNFRADFVGWFSRNRRGGPDSSIEDRTNPIDNPEPIITDYDMYGLNLEYDFGSVVATSTTSYIEYLNNGVLQLTPGNPDSDLITILDNTVFSQEVRLYSENSGPFNWSLGGFYRNAEDFRASILPIFFPSPILEDNRSKSYAIFGELIYDITDRLQLTGGLRYFNDDVEYEEFSRFGSVIIPPSDLIVSSDNFDVITPRVSLTWFANDDTTVYASYSQGFRSGFEQGGDIRVGSTGSPAFDPVTEDLLSNYEIGIKGSVAEGRLNYTLAAFYIDWKDTQQQLFAQVPLGDGTTVSVTAPINGEDASGFGIDASFDADITDQFSAFGSIGWNDLTFDVLVLTASDVQIFDEGDRLPESPELTANFGAAYEFPIGNSGWTGELSGSGNFTTALESRSASTGAIFEGDDILTAKFEFELVSPDNYSVSLFVNNATDEDGVVRPVSSTRPWLTPRLRPRTIGVQFNVAY